MFHKHIFCDGAQQLFPISSLNLRGIHNAQNACAVLAVLKYFELEALAVCKRTKETIPYFHINNVPAKMVKQYFDDINHGNATDVDAIITKYEKILEQIMAGEV